MMRHAAPSPGFTLTSAFIAERTGGECEGTSHKDEHGKWSRTVATVASIDKLARDLGCTMERTHRGQRLICRICGPKVPHGLCDREKHDAYYTALERGGSRG